MQPHAILHREDIVLDGGEKLVFLDDGGLFFVRLLVPRPGGGFIFATPKILISLPWLEALGESNERVIRADPLRIEVKGQRLIVRHQNLVAVSERNQLRTAVKELIEGRLRRAEVVRSRR